MKRVLIAEDNPDLRDIFMLGFDKQVFDVSVAEDGEDAINRLNELQPDVLVLDINLPKRSGFDVLAYLQEHKEQYGVKVIVVTGNALAMNDDKAAFADLFLLKPVNLMDLVTFAERLTN